MRKVQVISAILACCRKYEDIDEMTTGRFYERRDLANKARKQLKMHGNSGEHFKVVSDEQYIYITYKNIRVMTICMIKLEILTKSS